MLAADFSSPLHLATGSGRDWFIVKEIFFFYPWFHMVWTGLHVAPHATANVFSIRCLISRELASDEACWQRNGRKGFRRLHQMAALLRHLGQNLVDGELAAGTAFFFFPSPPPFLLSLPLWQNVPDLTFIKLTFDFFHTLLWGCLTLLPLASLPLPDTLQLEFPVMRALVFYGTLSGVWGFLYY